MEQDLHRATWALSSQYQTSFRRLRSLRKEVQIQAESPRSHTSAKSKKTGTTPLQWAILVVVAVLVAGGGYFAYSNFFDGSAVARKAAARPRMPDFEGSRIDIDSGAESKYYSSTLTGKTVVVLFWGNDSKSLDWLRALRNQSDDGLLAGANAEVVCVFVGDDFDEGLTQARRYGNEKLVILDERGTASGATGAGVADAFAASEFPSLYAYDPFGRQVGEKLAPEQLEMAFAVSE